MKKRLPCLSWQTKFIQFKMTEKNSTEADDGDYRTLKYFGNIPEAKRYDYCAIALETADTFE